jgi:uncharacterized protein YdaU (DUF1376 family)
VNYYERHIGDYLKDTAHLSLLEHGIYTRLMDVYYTRESALPDDQVARLIGARSKEEREALQDVLREFFNQTEQGWVQDRCDREIQRYQDKQRKASASANARWCAQRPQSDGNANASETHDASGMRSQSERNAPNHQTPVTKPKKKKGAKAPSSTAELPTWMADLVALYHEVLPELPGVRVMDKARDDALRDFWNWVMTSTRTDGQRRATNDAEALAWARQYFERARSNDFIMGRGPRSPEHQNWRCSIEYLLSSRGMKKVLEETVVEAS